MLVLACALFSLEKISFSYCVLVLESEGLYHPPLILEATPNPYHGYVVGSTVGLRYTKKVIISLLVVLPGQASRDNFLSVGFVQPRDDLVQPYFKMHCTNEIRFLS